MLNLHRDKMFQDENRGEMRRSLLLSDSGHRQDGNVAVGGTVVGITTYTILVFVRSREFESFL